MLTSEGFQSDSTCVLKARSGKLMVVYKLFTLQTNDYDVIIEFRVDLNNDINDVIQKVPRHDGLIKAHAVR